MPKTRLWGNLALSFFAKLSTGYWNVMDPTNGFLALHAEVGRRLPFERIAKRFFFESDMLFHLGLLRAKVVDFPMEASYTNSKSNLTISSILLPFLAAISEIHFFALGTDISFATSRPRHWSW
jgi:hypothetical protein